MSSITDSALRRLARSAAPIWLVQCNPRTTGIRSSAPAERPDEWCVRRYTTDICRGDRFVLWLSGRDAGVYALGEITADVRPPVPAAGVPAKVVVDLLVDLFERPVARAVLRADARFAGETIVRQPFAANPHRLSAAAFDAIVERVDVTAARRPTAPPTR